MNKYEKLIEYIINDEEDRARALFHEIVVEKSREIYENIMDEEIGGSQADSFIDEISADVTADETELGLGEADDDMDMEVSDDMEDMDDDMEDMEDMEDMDDAPAEEELEDRVMDLESALDELKAEFDALMADEKDEPEHADMFASDEDEMKTEESVVREYVEKVTDGHGAEKKGSPEGHEAGKGGSVSVNKASPVAGKNDMGGSSKNLAQGGEEKGGAAKAKGEFTGQFQNKPGAHADLNKAPAAKTAEGK